MSPDDRFINHATFEGGFEVMSSYDKRSGLIFETRAPHPRISVDEIAAALGIDIEQFINP